MKSEIVGGTNMNTNLRTAFILQIHKNPIQVNKFIKQLISDDQADIYIHIDRKQYDYVNDQILVHPNVRILEKSIDCEWGDISQVDTTILLLKAVLDSGNQYDFICLRSGQDLLVKNNFKKFISKNSDKVFLNYRKIKRKDLSLVKIKWPKITRHRYSAFHPIRIYRRIIQILYRKGINFSPNLNIWPKEFSFYKGSQWFTIPFEVGKYMIDFIDENDWYYNYFENSMVPDECFFHTLIMNSPYKEQVINNNLLFLKWGETLNGRNSPQDLTSEDIEMIEKKDYFFARKFDEVVDESVINYFTEKIYFNRNKTLNENKNEVLIN